MKLVIREYVASLRERDELDAILPDLLSELGFNVFSRPRRGTTQFGVDVAAVGNDESDGEEKVFLFTVKPGDLTRADWDGSSQAVRSSLNEIRDVYIPTRIPPRYQSMKVVVCLCVGGDVQEQVRSQLTGYTRENTTDRISFAEWNGDKIAELLLSGVLREEILPRDLRSYFQKAVALVDEPEASYDYFQSLATKLCSSIRTQKQRVAVARQLYLCLWILFVWARERNNTESPCRVSELVLLHMWNLLLPIIGKKPNANNRALTTVLHHAVVLHININHEFLYRKIVPFVSKRHAVSAAIRSRSPLDVNLKLFDLLGRMSLVGIWRYWLLEQSKNLSIEVVETPDTLRQWAELGIELIENNPTLRTPIRDDHSIEITLMLLLAGLTQVDIRRVSSWVASIAGGVSFTVLTHRRYPCIYTEYEALVEHPREKTDEYREEATAGSTLIPLLAAFLTAMGRPDSVKTLHALKQGALMHCTLQLWVPGEDSEGALYSGEDNHGVAVTDLPLSETGRDLLETIRKACREQGAFFSLSANRTGYWPIILVACRHFRVPVPPHMWIDWLLPAEKPSESVTV